MNKTEVLSWMKGRGLSKGWLADRCRVSEKTVHNWFCARRPLPLKCRLVLQEEMARKDLQESESKNSSLVIDLSADEFDQICRMAYKEGKLPRVWAEERLVELAFMDDEVIGKVLEQARAGLPKSERFRGKVHKK
jgi:hypothetical protein